jgi:uncharacterized membrane protein YkvA (DUF1232 family)
MFAFLRSVFVLYRTLYADPRSPGGFRALLWIALIYLILPFDAIPDILPIAGQIDDLVAVPLLLSLALRWIKPDLLRAFWRQARGRATQADKHVIDVQPL